MEHAIANALGVLAGAAAGLILAGAARRQARPAKVPVRVEEPGQAVRRRRRRRKV